MEGRRDEPSLKVSTFVVNHAKIPMMKIIVNIIGFMAPIWTSSCSGIICCCSVIAFSCKMGSLDIRASFII